MEAYAHDAGGTLERADLEPKPGGSISLPQGKGRPAIEPGQKMVKMVALVPAALHRRSRIGAAIEGTSLAAIVRAMLIERGAVRLVDDPVQTEELVAYSYEPLPGGGVRSSAPAGMHDDTVMALALACWPFRERRAWLAGDVA